MTPGELLALKSLVAAEEARQTCGQLPDNRIADTDGVLQPKEDAMYSWISPNPYAHYNRFKVWFRDIQGRKRSLTFQYICDLAESYRLLSQAESPAFRPLT